MADAQGYHTGREALWIGAKVAVVTWIVLWAAEWAAYEGCKHALQDFKDAARAEQRGEETK